MTCKRDLSSLVVLFRFKRFPLLMFEPSKNIRGSLKHKQEMSREGAWWHNKSKHTTKNLGPKSLWISQLKWTAFCLCLSAEDVLMPFPPGRTAHLPGSEGSSVWCHLWKRLVCFSSAVYFAFMLFRHFFLNIPSVLETCSSIATKRYTFSSSKKLDFPPPPLLMFCLELPLAWGHNMQTDKPALSG